MKKQVVLAAAAALMTAIATGGTAIGEDSAKNAKKEVKRTGVTREQLVTATASVQAINLEKRVVTLKGPEGQVFDVKVGTEARNLPQVKVGDTVTVTYYEAIAYRLLKPDEAPVPPQQAVVAERAKAGDKPGGVVAEETTITAKIEAIDLKTQKVTLKGPDGKSFTVKAQDPKNLKSVKVGNDVVITYTEAVAIDVTPKK